MRFAGALLPLAALALSAAAGQAPPAPRQAASDTPNPTAAVLLGQVVDADTGQPIADATVTLTGRPAPARGRATPAPASASLFDLMLARGGTSAERVVSTGNGRFVFRGLPASTYTLRAEAPGYVDNPTALRVAGAVAFVEIREKQTSASATLRLWRQAVITGTVLDEAGEPVIGANVRAYRRTVSRFGQLSYDSPDSASTDDRGRYRLSRLDPGDYLVVVPQSHSTAPAGAADAAMQSLMSGQMPEGGLNALGNAGSFMDPRAVRVGEWRLSSTNVQSPGASDGTMLAYRSVFFSSAFVPTEATWLTVRSGEERGGVDFALQPVPTGRINGVVTGPSGPVGNLPIRLVPAGGRLAGDPAALDVATGQTQADGRFALLAVPPGEYRVIARREPPAELPADLPDELASNPMMQMVLNMQRGASRIPLFGETTIAVRGGEAADVAIAVSEGVSLSGVVVFQDGPAPVGRDVTRAVVALRPLDAALLGARTMRPAADGKLTAAGLLPGRYGVSATLVLQGTSWVVKSVTANGREVTRAALVVEDRPVTDFTLVLTRQTGTVRGTVRRDNAAGRETRAGSPPPALTAVAVPANFSDWKDFELLIDRVYFGGVLRDGAFRLGPMLPGEYYVVVVDESQIDPGQGLALVRALATQATRITVSPGDNPVTVPLSRLPR
jgi:protocatechuate 3,4-dioxygenase beta subunit